MLPRSLLLRQNVFSPQEKELLEERVRRFEKLVGFHILHGGVGRDENRFSISENGFYQEISACAGGSRVCRRQSR